MLYKKYGNLDIDISVIASGGMRFENPDDIDKSAELINFAYESDINYFDTAPFYSNDKSEEIFGCAIKQMHKTHKEKPFYISTKSMESEPAKIRQQAERSLKRLGVDCIDFYHMWSILTLDSYNDRKAKGALKEFEKLKSEGLVKHIVVSTHLPGSDIPKLLADYPFEGVLLGYSAMNFAYRDAGIDAAAKSGRGVVVMNPLGGGLIPQNPEKFSFVKTQPDETVTEGALRFLINDPRITTALVGFANKDEITQAVKAVNGFKPIPAEKIQQIRAGIQKDFNELCTACQYCDKCPKGIPVPKFMDAYNLYKLSGKPIDMINRLRWHWGIQPENEYINKCNECGQCEKLCTQKLDIRRRLFEIREEIARFLEEEKAKN